MRTAPKAHALAASAAAAARPRIAAAAAAAAELTASAAFAVPAVPLSFQVRRLQKERAGLFRLAPPWSTIARAERQQQTGCVQAALARCAALNLRPNAMGARAQARPGLYDEEGKLRLKNLTFEELEEWCESIGEQSSSGRDRARRVCCLKGGRCSLHARPARASSGVGREQRRLAATLACGVPTAATSAAPSCPRRGPQAGAAAVARHVLGQALGPRLVRRRRRLRGVQQGLPSQGGRGGDAAWRPDAAERAHRARWDAQAGGPACAAGGSPSWGARGQASMPARRGRRSAASPPTETQQPLLQRASGPARNRRSSPCMAATAPRPAAWRPCSSRCTTARARSRATRRACRRRSAAP